MGAIATAARELIERGSGGGGEQGSKGAGPAQSIVEGERGSLGDLFNQNHALLQAIGVSSPTLDRLVDAARAAGAFGAKLSGGGRGGNVIALVNDSTRGRSGRGAAVGKRTAGDCDAGG